MILWSLKKLSAFNCRAFLSAVSENEVSGLLGVHSGSLRMFVSGVYKNVSDAHQILLQWQVSNQPVDVTTLKKKKADYIERLLETTLMFLLCHHIRQAHKLLQLKGGARKDT